MLTGLALTEALKDLHTHGFVLLEDLAAPVHLLDSLGHHVELLQGGTH
jgi:hypothetical protein